MSRRVRNVCLGLAGLMLGIGVVLYGVNVLVKRSLDRETPQAMD